VWLLNRFTLSLRIVQEMLLLERGVVVSHETLREWNQKFAVQTTLEIKHRRAAPGKTCLDRSAGIARAYPATPS
jgi:putative transposase